ncbi:MAG: hypothetical protein DMG28_10535 [Acidobacteria bacterium]|nr:MAG: hypothetical protein DMG28_10535 [Acidobacteriota bacterium]
MGTWPAKKGPQRACSVGQDWRSWLPAEKDDAFGTAVAQLERCYAMLSVTLNEAFELRDNGGLIHAREQVGICADLFDLLAVRLLAALRAMEEHGRHFGTLPNVAALNPDFFRGETAQRNARKNTIVSKLLFSARSSLFHKLRSLADTVEDLQGEFREATEEIADGASTQPGARWQALDILHYDLNTCLREAMVMLKSFLCALPSEEMQLFQQKLKAPASPAVYHRRATLFRRK